MGATSPISGNLPVTYSPYGTAIRGSSQPALSSQSSQSAQAGQYGRNAHNNYMQAQNLALRQLDNQGASKFSRASDLAKLSTATIRYNPEAATSKADLVMNAYGYAQADIASLGGEGYLDKTQLINHFGADAADSYMKAVDLNQDKRITPDEQAAFTVFSDNGPRYIADTLTAYAQTPDSLPGIDPNVLLHWSDQFASMTPSRLDGQITAGERVGAEQAVNLAPNFARVTLSQIHNTLDIPGTVSASEQGQPVGNPFTRAKTDN